MDVEAVNDGLERHVREFFADRQVVERSDWIAAHARERLPRLRLLEAAPRTDGDSWISVSIGAWEVTRQERHGLEVVYLSTDGGPAGARIVEMTAYYHANPDDCTYRLWEGHTIPLGRPIVEASALDHLVVSKPYPLGPGLELAEVQGVHVHFFWLLPISAAETAYRHEHGLEALEGRFDDIGLEYWRLDRGSVV